MNAVAYTVQVTSTGQPWDAGAFVGAVASGAATGTVAAVSIVVEPIDYALTAVQCVTAGCSVADVALTVVPGAIGPIARQVDNVLDIARAAENASDSVKAVESAADAVKIGDVCSFSADTLVATEDGEQAISALEVGDLVLAYDEALGLTGLYTVTAVWAHTDAQTVYLTIHGEQIETTAEHPFLTWAGAWVPAGELWVGAQVHNAEGEYGTVEAVEVVYRPQPMYNLTVAQAHTYFVGDGQWLVHNACPIYGKVQSGTTAAHNAKMKRIADKLANSGDFDEVWLDTQVRKATRWDVPNLNEPDVLGLNFERKSAHIVEVMSPSQRPGKSGYKELLRGVDKMTRDFRKHGWKVISGIVEP